MTAADVKALIEAGIEQCQADVHSADNVHFEARVVSPAFDGQRKLARHRMVYATLGTRMGGEIHALSLDTLTPDEAN